MLQGCEYLLFDRKIRGGKDGIPVILADVPDVVELEDVVEEVSCRGKMAACDGCAIKATKKRTQLLR